MNTVAVRADAQHENGSPSSASNAQPLATLQVHIQKYLTSGSGSSFLLDVNFCVSPGITILFGASGAGKTTLLDCIAGILTPDAGSIAAGGLALFDSERRINLPAQQRNVGYVFQDLALFPHMTVEANMAYGLSGLTAR